MTQRPVYHWLLRYAEQERLAPRYARFTAPVYVLPEGMRGMMMGARVKG